MTNKLYALVGPHGAGKATIIEALRDMGMHYISHHTTYKFHKGDKYKDLCIPVSREDFPRENYLVRFTHKGGYFGLKKPDILDALNNHGVSVTILEQNGIRQLRNFLHESLVTIYLMVDYMTIVERLVKLGYKNQEMRYHLQYADNNNEFDAWKICDHVVKNTGEMDVTLRQILAIMDLDRPLYPEELQRRLG